MSDVQTAAEIAWRIFLLSCQVQEPDVRLAAVNHVIKQLPVATHKWAAGFADRRAEQLSGSECLCVKKYDAVSVCINQMAAIRQP